MDNDRTAVRQPFIPALSMTSDAFWLVVEDGFNILREHEIEALFSVSNGYVGTRGSLAEGSSFSSPATFIAGVFDTASGASTPELAAGPDWLHLSASIDQEALRLETPHSLRHRRILDMRQGMVWREWVFQDAKGRISRLHGFRFASLADRHLLVQSIWLTPVNYSAQLALAIGLSLPPSGPEQAVLVAAPTQPDRGDAPSSRVVELTNHGGLKVAFAMTAWLRMDEQETDVPSDSHQGTRDANHWEIPVEMGKAYRLDRVVAVYTSRDLDQPAEAASQHLAQRLQQDVDLAVVAHIRAWTARWEAADIVIEGDEAAQRAIRFAGYHLISAANPADTHVSIGARTLTGSAYKGHVFWDTELFMLPFYIFTHPPAARALLMYRYHTLPAAREKARRMGYRGALYAWESADTGEETTPPYVLAPDGEVIRILSGEQEQHISADVAYAVWQYWQASQDEDFLLQAGAEILIETARFWASRVEIEADGRYHIHQVIGPDEYHENVGDNAYTNGMARWNLECALELTVLLQQTRPKDWTELNGRLQVTDTECKTWQEVSQKMHIGQAPDSGLLEQFKGYFQLEDIDLAPYAERDAPMDVLLGRERTQQSQVIKQADVVMLLFLLWERFAPAVRAANFQYYEARTGHGSSLSPSVHALVAARLGDMEAAMRYFRQAAEIDLANNMGNAAGGVHAAALGGLWQAIIFGFAGLSLHGEGIAFEPRCPTQWRSVHFPLQWRDRHLSVRMTPSLLEVTAQGALPLSVSVGGNAPTRVNPGATMRWERSVDQWWEIRT